MDPTKIVVIFAAIILGIILFFSQYYTNISVQEEDLVLSVHYLENISKIDSAIINLDFINKKMKFESTFYVDDTTMKLDSKSRGFEDDRNCSDDLVIHSKNGSKWGGRTWHDNELFLLDEYGEIDFIELSKTCDFFYDLVPNGEFTVQLFGKDQTGVSVENIQLNVSLDSKQYDCDIKCVTPKQEFDYIDFIDTEKNIRTATLDGRVKETRFMEFDLHAINVNYENWSNFLFNIFLVGIGVSMTIIVYVFSTKQQDQIKKLISKIDARDREQLDEKQERKKFYEREYVLTLVEIRATILEITALSQKILNKKSDDMDSIKKKWQFLQTSVVDRLEHLNYTSFDVVDHIVIDDVDLIKNTLKRSLGVSQLDIISQMGHIETQISRLMTGELMTRRLEVKKVQQSRVDEEIKNMEKYGGSDKNITKLQKEFYERRMSYFDYPSDP